MTKGNQPKDPPQQDPGEELTIESFDSMAPAEQQKNASPARPRRSSRKGSGGEGEPKGNRPESCKMDRAKTGFEVPIGDSGPVLQSAWRFGA